MVKSIQNETRNIIVEFEMIKKRVLKSTRFEDLISEIDDALALTYKICDHRLSGQNELFAKFHYSITHLKDIRAYLLDLRPEYVRDFGHEINLSIGTIQFELWSESKQGLYELLDSVA